MAQPFRPAFPPAPAEKAAAARPSPSARGAAARRWGHWCETLGFALLWLRGWDLVGRNVRLGRWEMDLLITRGPELRLVEVKARRAGVWSGADTALAPEQRMRLQLTLRAWLDRHPWPGNLSFQRLSFSGWQWRFHPPERWDFLKIPR